MPWRPWLQQEGAKVRPLSPLHVTSEHETPSCPKPKVWGSGVETRERESKKEPKRVLRFKTVMEHTFFLVLHLLIKCPIPSGVCFELLLIIFS